MPLEYRFDSDANCLLIRAYDDRSVQDYRALAQALKDDCRIRPQYLRFTDVRHVSDTRSHSFARQVASFMNDLDRRKPIRRGAVLVNESIQFGMVRLYQAHLNDPNDKMHVFRDLAEALDWLGLPQDMSDPFDPGTWAPEKRFTTS